MNDRRLYLAIAAAALVAYAGALWNGFALDDIYIILQNPLVQSADGVWRAFAAPYWPPDLGGSLYRPLPIATYALDWLIGSPAWFHFVNLLWHAVASVAVAALARYCAGDRAALIAGLLFAVHPVHVEAVANVVGRAELMAATFTVVAVWAALGRGSVAWSAAAIGAGLFCKENAAVAPALIAWGWLVGLSRPSRRMVVSSVIAWALVGTLSLAARRAALRQNAPMRDIAAVFVGETPSTVRLTAVAAAPDVARLLVFPWRMRVDYSPAERTAVRTPLDARVVLGVAILALWGALLLWTWRRGRKVEAFGLGWIGIAYLPVANLVVPIGVLIAERTLYLPSAGLVLALGASGGRLAALSSGRAPVRMAWIVGFGALVVAAAARAALRVPVWKDDVAVTRSILKDSPRSFWGHSRAGVLLQARGRPEEALGAFANALAIYDRDASLFVAAADAAFTVGRPDLAAQLLARADRVCYACPGLYRAQAASARSRGDPVAADSLLARAVWWESQ